MSDHEDVRDSLFGPPLRKRNTAHDGELTNPGSVSNSSSSRRVSKTLWDQEQLTNPADVEHNNLWNVTLAQLLGRLEFGRSSLEDISYRHNPSGAVRIAAAMVHEVADFIAKNIDRGLYEQAVTDALTAAAKFMTAAQLAGERPRRGLFGLFSSEKSAVREECMWVLRDLPLVLERYFTLLSGGFRHPAAAVDWVTTSGLFISELKRALGWVEGFTETPAT